MTALPQTPAEARAEAQRLRALREGAEATETWYYQPGWGLQKTTSEGVGLLASSHDFATHHDLLLLESVAGTTELAIALLEQHAQQLERKEALRRLAVKWQAEAVEDGPLVYGSYEPAEAANVEKDDCATELLQVLDAPAKASAGAEGGGA